MDNDDHNRYLHSQVVDGCWRWFEPQISDARDLRALRALHDLYAERCADHCFLRTTDSFGGGESESESGGAVRSTKLQHQVLSCILTCYRCVFRFRRDFSTIFPAIGGMVRSQSMLQVGTRPKRGTAIVQRGSTT